MTYYTWFGMLNFNLCLCPQIWIFIFSLYKMLIILFCLVIYLQMDHQIKSKVISPITNRQKNYESVQHNTHYQTQLGSSMYRSQMSHRRKPIFTTPDRNISSQKKQYSQSNTPQTVRKNNNLAFKDSHQKQRIYMEQFPSRIGDSQQYQQQKQFQREEDRKSQKSFEKIKPRILPQTPIKKHFKQRDQLSANRQFLNSKNSLFKQQLQQEQIKDEAGRQKELYRQRKINQEESINYQKGQIVQQMKDLLYRMQTKNQTISFQIRQNQRLKQQNQFLKQKNKELFAKCLQVQKNTLDDQLIQNQNIQYKKSIIKAKNILMKIESSDPQIKKELKKIEQCLEL